MKRSNILKPVSKLAIAAAGVACVVMPVAASAQSSTPSPTPAPIAYGNQAPSSIRRGNMDFQQQYDRFYLNADDPISINYAGAASMAECVARRSKGGAASYFGGPTTDDPQYAKLSKVLTGKYQNCIDKRVSDVPMYVINAALAEHLLKAEDMELPDKPASLDVDKANAFYLTDGKITSLDALDKCIAVNSPGLVMKFLKTKAGSKESDAALAAAYAGTPECGVATPPTAAKTVEHREMLATALYEWTSIK